MPWRIRFLNLLEVYTINYIDINMIGAMEVEMKFRNQQFMGALYASHYLWVVFAFQVIAAVSLLELSCRAD